MKVLAFGLMATLLPTGVFAETSAGTETVTATVESSINLTIESSGGTTSGTGTGAASSALGSIKKYGTAPTGFTQARGATDWTVSSTIGVKVAKANLTSTDYTLTAQLGTAAATGVAWKLNGSTLKIKTALNTSVAQVFPAWTAFTLADHTPPSREAEPVFIHDVKARLSRSHLDERPAGMKGSSLGVRHVPAKSSTATRPFCVVRLVGVSYH